ncbi:YPDG domain-containing protein, partial [Mammaliicoccus sciuri]|uniref:YPDG domain-containing protein n=1 Tax=Mammaliicoccus sciuri TaxID=1296 RepID=UPI003A8D8BA9
MDKQRKLQKFSIRKYTVGTCSILIGTLIFLGLPTHDAFASENVIQKHAQEEKAEGKSTYPVEEASAIEETSSNVEETKEIGTAETPAEQPQEEATTEAPAVDETTQDTTTNEESTTEDKSTTEEASTEEATQVDTVAPEATKVETAEKAEQPQEEATEVAKEETTTEETAETAESAVNTVDAVQPASVEETPAVDTPTVEATVTNTVSDVDTSSVSSKSLEDIVNDQNKDKVEATTLEQPSRQAPKSGASYGSVFRAAELQTREVSNWDQYLAALNDRNVGTINFTNDITMPKAKRRPLIGNKTDAVVLDVNAARAVTINLNGHLLNTQDNYLETKANTGNKPAWNITFNNGHIHSDDNEPGPARENAGIIQFETGSHGHVMNFRDIEHTGSTLTNDYKLTVNVFGNFTSNNEGKRGADKNTTFGANVIRFAENSNIKMSMTTQGKMLKVYADDSKGKKQDMMNGILSFGHNSNINLDSSSTNPWDGDNTHTVIQTVGGGTRVTFGKDSTVRLAGQDIISFGVNSVGSTRDDYGMLDIGSNTTVKVDQRGNGNVVDMHSHSIFNIGPNSDFNIDSVSKLNNGNSNGLNTGRTNNLIGLNSDSEIVINEGARLRLHATKHQRPDDSSPGRQNPLIVLTTAENESARILVKENATLDVSTDNKDYHSEILSFPGLGGGANKGLIIEGTAKYVNLQRTTKVRGGAAGSSGRPTGENSLIYGQGTTNLSWAGDHKVMTWNSDHMSNKDNPYNKLEENDASNPDDKWDNINNYSATATLRSTTMRSLSNPDDPDASSRNTVESNDSSLKEKKEKTHKNIKDMQLGRTQRFVLIGQDVELNSTEERKTVYTAVQDESKAKGEQTTTQEGRDGVRTKYTSRYDGSESYVYKRERDSNGNEYEVTPIEKHVDVNTLEVTNKNVDFETIYEADNDKLTTEPNETIQEGVTGKVKVTTVYKLNEETGELIETVETAEDGTQTNPVVTEETLVAKQDKRVKVGAKEVSTAEIPVEIDYIDNPDLEAGTEKVVNEGQAGTKTVTKVYNIDPNTGEKTTVESTQENITTPMRKKVVERGTGTHASLNNPGYSDTPTDTKPGKAIDVPQTIDTELPAGTKFSIPEGGVPTGWTATIDPNTGKVTVTPPADATEGTTAEIPVEVTYPDKSKDTATAKVQVVKNDAQNNDPNYGNEPTPTKPGKAVDVPQTGDTDLPAGTTYEIPDGADIPDGWTATVDPNTGVVTVTPPANASNGDIANIPVKVKYPDGSSDDTTVPVKVVSNQANDYTPGYEDQTTIPGKTIKITQTGDETLPKGTKFEIPAENVPDGWDVHVDPGTGELSVTAPGEDNVLIKVLVRYPDGTSEEISAFIEVNTPNSVEYPLTYGGKEVPVTRGTANEVSLIKSEIPKNTVFELAENEVPKDVTATINSETGVITVIPDNSIPVGHIRDIKVIVNYPDGSTDILDAKVIVEDNNSSSDDNSGSDTNDNTGSDANPNNPDSGSDTNDNGGSDSDTNGGSDMNSGSNDNSGSNTDSSSDSQSDKDSNSANDSSSDSNDNNGSDSANDSNSATDSSSDANNDSGSNTNSSSDNQSEKDSGSANDSNSATDSSSDSNNDSGSNTDSSSDSQSDKDSGSATDSSSATDSNSDSNSNSGSDMNSDSNNDSGSNTDSSSDSQSDKDSN